MILGASHHCFLVLCGRRVEQLGKFRRGLHNGRTEGRKDAAGILAKDARERLEAVRLPHALPSHLTPNAGKNSLPSRARVSSRPTGSNTGIPASCFTNETIWA